MGVIGVEGDDEPIDQAEALKEIVFGKGIISLCLLVIPVSLWAIHFQWSDTWIFWLNFVVMIPLAAILGDFTEEVALHTNEVTGGLINASYVPVGIHCTRAHNMAMSWFSF